MAEPSKARLGKYELLEVIGDGSEGRVYRARCCSTRGPSVVAGELVALKRLRETGDHEIFVVLVVSLGEELGYIFTSEDVEAALRTSRRAWLERWIQK